MKNSVLTVAVLLMLAVPAVYGQAPEPPIAPPGMPPGPPPGPPGMLRMEEPPMPPAPPAADKPRDRDLSELVEAVMMAKLAKELGLNDEQTVLLVRRFGEFKKQLDDMKRQRQEKLKTLRAALKDKATDEAAMEAALQDLISHDVQTLQFRKSAYQKAAETLTVSQRARLYLFISDFEADMRRLVQKAREGGPGAMRQPPRPGMPGGPLGPGPGAQRLQRGQRRLGPPQGEGPAGGE